MHGEAWLGSTGRGLAEQGKAGGARRWQGAARRGLAWFGWAPQGTAGQARPGLAMPSLARPGVTGQGPARPARLWGGREAAPFHFGLKARIERPLTDPGDSPGD
jgi:hypothetical protein